MNANRPLWQRAVLYSTKLFITLRLVTLLWVLLFALINKHPIIQPYGLCESGTLVESSRDVGIHLSSFMRWDTVCYLQIAEHGYAVHPVLTVWPRSIRF